MKTEWLHYQENDWLIIFCNGWGMDSTPFKPLLSRKYDVLCCYDYSENLKGDEFSKLAKVYERIHLVGWSMGVACGQKQFTDIAHIFDKAIAINGTLQPVDELYGIPIDICNATLQTLDEETAIKFYRRMCRSSEVYQKFMRNRPERTINDIKNELSVIIDNMEPTNTQDSIYTHVMIADKDMIVPTMNQVRSWDNANVKRLQSGHFPFYLWNSWDDLLDFAG